MAHSYAQSPILQCPPCGASFVADIWLIIDTAERPDLLGRVMDGSIHTVVCPNRHASDVDAPLLLYRPGEETPLLFSPARQTTIEQDREMAGGLVALLCDSLGGGWRDEWLEGFSPVPREALPALQLGPPQPTGREPAARRGRPACPADGQGGRDRTVPPRTTGSGAAAGPAL